MALNPTESIRLVCFDLDGTLIDNTIYIWSTLHEHFGSDPVKRKQASEDFFAGRITYREWFFHDLELLKAVGADRQGMIESFVALKPTRGAHETLRDLDARGYKLALISGSLDLVLDHFFPGAPFAHVLLNRIHFDEAGKIAGGEHTPYDLEGKARGLEEIARREGLTPAECAFVGDNVNDLPVMKVAGYAIGVNIKSPKVLDVADQVVDNPDLRSILSLFEGPPS